MEIIRLAHILVEVVAKHCTEASSLDVSLRNWVKPFRSSGKSAPVVAEEESVAVPEFLKLPLDDAGKEGAHLLNARIEKKDIKMLTIPSAGAVSARPAVNGSIRDGSLL